LTDLSAQTDDKQRLDTRGACKVELSHARAWLTDADNAIREDEPELARKAFDRVRAQLKMLDQRIALSQLQAQLGRIEQALQKARAGLEQAKNQLVDKRVKLKVLKAENEAK
jgi:hypothetical protein